MAKNRLNASIYLEQCEELLDRIDNDVKCNSIKFLLTRMFNEHLECLESESFGDSEHRFAVACETLRDALEELQNLVGE